jgi:D-3-phosphoglycerate dehydrogenase
VYCRGQEEIDYSTVDVVLVGLRDVVDDEFLRRFPRVKYVGSNTTGVDHIRTKRPIEVVHLDPREIESVSATAEFTLALLLSIARKIPFVDEAQAGDRKAYRGRQLRGKTLGVFGMGRLGRKMARYAEALGMSWVGYDRGQSEAEKAAVLRNADVITLHLPLNDETAGFLGYDEFALMEKKPFVVNTSRPQLIDKAALLDALDRSLVAGVAMDFINYDGSDRWDPDLRKHLGERLLLTPHIAGNTYESVRYTAGVVVEKLVRRVRSETAS